MRRFLFWLGFIAVVAVAGGVVYLMWDFDWRWQPKTLTKDQDEIGKELKEAGWVSPHLTGPPIYMVSFRACPDCISFQQAEFPKLQTAGIDTRVIEIALADDNGQSHSTPAERATVAELWTNRSWKLYQEWQLSAADAWSAPGVPPADGDAARTAVIEAGRALATTLTSQLKDNGVGFGYPTLIWWTKDGKMRVSVGGNPHTYRAIEKDLGL